MAEGKGSGGRRPGGKTQGPAGRRPAAGGARRPAGAAAQPADPRGERLQKVMAHAGVASRRHSEELIQAGRVTVDGKVVTELGTRVRPGERVEVDGKPLSGPEKLVYILLNKPRNCVTTLYDPQGRTTVLDFIQGVEERVYPVGRLDYDTEGVLLLTNDGALSHALAHPARLVKKTYMARVRGVPTAANVERLRNGVELDDGPTAPAEARLVSAGDGLAVVSITIHEGRNRQVRRMFEAIGHEVIGLRRVRLGNLDTRGLAPGAWRALTEDEVRDLYHHAGLKWYGARPEPVAARGRFQVAGRLRRRDAAEPVVGDRRGRTGAAGETGRPAGPSMERGYRPGQGGKPAFAGPPAGRGRKPAPAAGPAARGGQRPTGGPARGPGRRGPALPAGPLGDEIRTALARLAEVEREADDVEAPQHPERKPRGAAPAPGQKRRPAAGPDPRPAGPAAAQGPKFAPRRAGFRAAKGGGKPAAGAGKPGGKPPAGAGKSGGKPPAGAGKPGARGQFRRKPAPDQS